MRGAVLRLKRAPSVGVSRNARERLHRWRFDESWIGVIAHIVALRLSLSSDSRLDREARAIRRRLIQSDEFRGRGRAARDARSAVDRAIARGRSAVPAYRTLHDLRGF